MNRRRAVIALLIVTGSMMFVPAASADMAPPPVLLRIEGRDATLTAAAPDRAEFVISNSSDEPIEVFVYRLVVLDGNMRVPVTIDRLEKDGAASGRTVIVPANGRVRLAAHFELPQHMHGRARYRIDLSVRQSGYGVAASSPATIERRGRSRT